MKKAGFILFTVLFFVMCTVPILFMPLTTPDGGAPPPPALYTKEDGVNLGFGPDMENYLTQNFAGRNQLVTLNARLKKTLFATSAEPKVIVGKDDWLFYTETLDDYLGINPLSKQDADDIATVMALMEEYANTQGSHFFIHLRTQQKQPVWRLHALLHRAVGAVKARF